ncbi:SAM-dependent methyltransferase [Streptomyces sp. NPDC019224]|uniref:SAM-dependent methyltransferase n=1 Tax=Streptomyces sp. NPDC019224 TaxID=3154484 RepID=UPI003411E8DA
MNRPRGVRALLLPTSQRGSHRPDGPGYSRIAWWRSRRRGHARRSRALRGWPLWTCPVTAAGSWKEGRTVSESAPVRDDAAIAAAAPAGVDPQAPHVPRVMDYLLGGTANFEIDRQAAALAFQNWPGETGGVAGVRVDIGHARAALGRVVRHLVADRGITQFLDIASGLPTMGNVHLAARELAPEAKVVYVDNDPQVVAHAQHLLAEESGAEVVFLQGDFHEPGKVLARAAETLDFTRPVGLVLFGMLHFVEDFDEGARLLAGYLGALPPGSCVAVSHFARDDEDTAMNATLDALDAQLGEAVVRRTRTEVEKFFDGLEVAEPGIVETQNWRPTDTSWPAPLPMWVGVARKR